MARIGHPAQPGRSLVLLPVQTLGRMARLRLRDPDPHVSANHAELRWNGACWQVEDLGSRNGTWVDGKRLAAREAHELRKGTVLAFGRPDNAWLVIDDSPPLACAERVDGTVVEARDGILALPDEQAPVLSVYYGPDGHWTMDDAQGTHTIKSGSQVHDGEQAWVLHLPEAKVQTITRLDASPTPSSVDLHLHLGREDEIRQIHMVHEGRRLPVEHRTSSQLLVYLARARCAPTKGAPRSPAEIGWVRQIDLELHFGIGNNSVNVAVHRLRHMFQSAGLTESAGVVERRQRPPELRLGFRKVVIKSS